ncbi:MAG: hypothetical protein AAGC56_02315 [Pseudomonadota bacterium]
MIMLAGWIASALWWLSGLPLGFTWGYAVIDLFQIVSFLAFLPAGYFRVPLLALPALRIGLHAVADVADLRIQWLTAAANLTLDAALLYVMACALYALHWRRRQQS